ncbi:hypothetical protein [Mycoplasmopsis cynos]|nr:hypothetical protein [Mycoplasmopsis cynos]UWV77596.1 hypothetical protein NW070_01505 [Mycoplasmopsis cynos]
MQPYKDELNRFWTKEKGDYLRGEKKINDLIQYLKIHLIQLMLINLNF